MGSGRRQISTPKLGRGNYHSFCTGVKDLVGKISHLRRENNIRRKKIPLARQCDLTPWEIFLGSNLCPLHLVSRLRLSLPGCMCLCWWHYCLKFNKAGPKGTCSRGEKKKYWQGDIRVIKSQQFDCHTNFHSRFTSIHRSFLPPVAVVFLVSIPPCPLSLQTI